MLERPLALLMAGLLLTSPVMAESTGLGAWPVLGNPSAYRTLQITVEDVEAVEIRVFTETVRFDCNSSNERIEWKRVAGEGQGVGDTYVAEYHPATMQTMMNCPYEKPVTKTLFSEPLKVQPARDGQGRRGVDLTWVIPKHCQLEVVHIE